MCLLPKPQVLDTWNFWTKRMAACCSPSQEAFQGAYLVLLYPQPLFISSSNIFNQCSNDVWRMFNLCSRVFSCSPWGSLLWATVSSTVVQWPEVFGGRPSEGIMREGPKVHKPKRSRSKQRCKVTMLGHGNTKVWASLAKFVALCNLGTVCYIHRSTARFHHGKSFTGPLSLSPRSLQGPEKTQTCNASQLIMRGDHPQTSMSKCSPPPLEKNKMCWGIFWSCSNHSGHSKHTAKHLRRTFQPAHTLTAQQAPCTLAASQKVKLSSRGELEDPLTFY